LFPQSASSTTGSVKAGLEKAISGKGFEQVEVIDHFYSNAEFIEAWTQRANEHDLSTYDHILFSYHGLPERHITKDDQFGNCLQDRCCEAIDARNSNCYRAQCYETTKLITASLDLPTDKYSISFQSRLGKSPWIRPYTDETLVELAKKGHKKLLVFAPAFVADCLETLQEIGMEYKELFVEHGGKELTLVESLNDHPAWVTAVKEIVTGS
jgi:ferrochelatase